MTSHRIKAQVTLTQVQGFAGKLYEAFDTTPYVFDERKMKQSLVDPCDNCEELIRRLGLTLSNFTNY